MRNHLLILLFIASQSLFAQKPFHVALVNDKQADNPLENLYEQNVKEEIQQLLQHRYDLHINMYYADKDGKSIAEEFEIASTNNDVVVAIGTTSSNYALTLKEYSKPTLVSIVLDAELQGVNRTAEGTSGILNLTYLESPFDIERDINLLHQVYPYQQLLLAVEDGAIQDFSILKQLFARYLTDKNVSIAAIDYNSDWEAELAQYDEQQTAVYALPYLGADSTLLERFYKTLNAKKKPSAALFGEENLAKGAFLGYHTHENLHKIPRRIALTIMKIAEGQPASELSVVMENFSENLLFNMETARQIGIYPKFEVMSEATLVNLENIQTDNTLSLQEAIARALQSNLQIRIEEADVAISGTEIDLAKADLLPELEVSTSLAIFDEQTTFTYQGAQGRTNWLASGELTQVLFAEPILANVAINKMLKMSEEKELLQTQLDVIIDVANAYMNILFAKSNLNIQQQNVARTKENYDISTAKEATGYTGASDINRWEAELANANINLNQAYAGLRQAKFQLNQLLNRPINEAIEVEEITLEESMLMITDARTDFIDDYGKLEQFSNFLVNYSKAHLPELAQVDIGLEVQKRLQLSRERALYLPTVALNASANTVLQKYNVPEGLPPLDNITTWNIGLGVSYPIFQGNSRRKLIQQSRLNVLQLEDTRKNLENQLEFRIRANLETVGASYSSMRLSKIAAEASNKNYEIIKDAYSAGQANITTLIDAQNNALATELSAINAIYTFILDFLTLERSVGFYNFLATPAERDAFFQATQQYLEK